MTLEIKVPTLGESIAEATVGRWLKQKGDAVLADETIVELETDKVALEVNAPVAGVLTDILAEEGANVEVGDIIAVIDPEGVPATSPPKPVAEDTKQVEISPPTPASSPAPSAPAAGAYGPMSPAVRKLVSEHNLDARAIAGSGKDGRLTKGDVMAAIEAGTAGVSPASTAPSSAYPANAAHRQEERIPMSRLRKRIAERLKEAQNTAAMLTTHNEADMTQVMAARARYKELFAKKHDIKLGFMSFFVKACIHALREVPAVNAEIDGDDIIYRNYYDIGVAVSTPTGLVVPIVRNAENLSFAETEKTIMDFGLRARDGKLKLEEIQGGTFTISNGGIFGSLLSSPILNPPQSGILGMHKIQERPVTIDGEVVIRPMMSLALTYDHRLIDGREAVTFLIRVKECLEDPTRMLLDL